MKNSNSIRLGNDYKEFDDNLMKNIIKAGGDKTSAKERASRLVKYFKMNNSSYLDLVNMENKNV